MSAAYAARDERTGRRICACGANTDGQGPAPAAQEYGRAGIFGLRQIYGRSAGCSGMPVSGFISLCRGKVLFIMPGLGFIYYSICLVRFYSIMPGSGFILLCLVRILFYYAWSGFLSVICVIYMGSLCLGQIGDFTWGVYDGYPSWGFLGGIRPYCL